MTINTGPVGVPWSMRQRDPAADSRAAVPGPGDPTLLGPPWPFVASGAILAAPAIDHADQLFPVTTDGLLYRVAPTGGGEAVYDAGAPVTTTPALALENPTDEGEPPVVSAIYVTSSDGTLHCVDPDGRLLWRLQPGLTGPTAGIALTAPALLRLPAGRSAIFIGCDDGRVIAVRETSATSAQTSWEFSTGGRLRTSPAIGPDGRTVHVAAADGVLHRLDAATGQPLVAPIPLTTAELRAPAVGADGSTYVTASDGTLYAVDPAGALAWSLPLGVDVFAGPALGDGDTVLAVADGVLIVVDRSGTVLVSEPLPPDRYRATPVIDGTGTAIITGDGGLVVGVDTGPGPVGPRVRWQVTVPVTAGTLGPPSLDGYGRTFVGAGDGRLHALDELPAFRLFLHGDLGRTGNIDVYSMRESFGVVDQARTARVTTGAGPARQPATSLDRRIIGFEEAGDVFVATPSGTRVENITASAGPVERDPAFTPVDDRVGGAKPPHPGVFTAVTGEAGGTRRLRFVELGGSGAIRSFTDWAQALGVGPAITAQLEPPGTAQSHAAFAPDGLKLAWRSENPATGSGQVLLLARAGGTWLLNPVGPAYPVDPEQQPGFEADEPCFSPDSRWLAVREGLSIAVHEVNGTVAPLYSTPVNGKDRPVHPDWSPDGTEIAVGVRRGPAVDVHACSGPGFGVYTPLTTTADADEPAFDRFVMPAPRDLSLEVDRAVPGATVRLRGRGLHILHPHENLVEFEDAAHTGRLAGTVLSAAVDPHLGLGVLTVRVPNRAGHGPLQVTTRFGTATTPAFHVLPDPLDLVRRRTVPGARIRVFGRGFDLDPASQHTVSFTAATGGTVSATAERGEVLGDQEFLVVRVPEGVAAVAAVSVANSFGSNPCAVQFATLTPTLTLRRPPGGASSGLPSYASQGATGVDVVVTGTGYPYDPFFGYGTGAVTLTADADPALQPVPPLPAVAIRTLGYTPPASALADTVDLVGAGFPFPGLGPAHPGGRLRIDAIDVQVPARLAAASFQVPETDIPIIFVPGTSGTSLDIRDGVLTPIGQDMPFHAHSFPWLSKNPTPWPANPFGPLIHFGRSFDYDPRNADTFPLPSPGIPADPRGARVWMGPEGITEFITTQPTGNVGNHYLDICAFDAAGDPVQPKIVPGTVLEDVLVKPFGGQHGAWSFIDVYKPFIDFLNTPAPNKGWAGRPVCRSSDPATGVCRTPDGTPASGRNGVYLFNLDWRQSLPKEAKRLADFVDAVRARPDVNGRKVTIITHSYGGPVARGYYLDPAHDAQSKVDQVISLGGGFLGVVEPLDILEQGGNWGLGFNVGGSGVGIQAWEAQQLAQNWPTAYFQQPNSEHWFDDHGTSVGGVVVDRSYVRDHRVGGDGDLTSFDASNTWVGARHNSALAQAHRDYFATGPGSLIGDFTAGTGSIYHHRIVGKGRLDTAVAVEVSTGPSDDVGVYLPLTPEWILAMLPTDHWRTVHGDGDSTVPYHGAIGLTDARDDRVYVIDGIAHSELPNVPEMIGGPTTKGLLQLLLEGNVGGITTAPAPFFSQSTPEIVPLTAVRPAEVTPDRWLIELTGLAELEVIDAEGRRVGPDPQAPARIENLVPGATFAGEASSSTAMLIGNGFEVRVTSIVTTDLRLHVRPFAGTTALPSTLFRTQLTGGTTATTSLAAEGPSALRTVAGEARARAVVGRQLSPTQAADTAPPTTRVRIIDGVLVADADDTGSGVARTLVSFDGVQHTRYDGPAPLPGHATVVMVHSEDVAGNVEFPGFVRGVLGVGTEELKFGRHEHESQRLPVLNLDRTRLSKPIRWRATTSAPWVRLTPETGETAEPSAELEISIDLTQVPAGDDVSAEITVQDVDPSAAVPARSVTVRLLAG